MERELSDMTSFPGADTRQWVSYGTVDPDGPDSRSVTFEKGLGPIVDVTLQPSGIPCRCRVAGGVAGAGEGEYYPFAANDEVLVLIPEGDERAHPVIVARMNNELDAWPDTVAANDPTQNNFGFRRMKAPWMVETAQAWGVRNAVTGALLMMEAAGSTTARDGFGDFLHLGPDFAGLQTTDDTDKTSPVTTPGSTVMVLQLDKKNKQVRAEVTGKAIMLLGEQGSVVGTTGALQVSTQGATASEHVATTEQVLNILNNFLLLLSGFSAPGALAALSAPPARDAFLASVLSAAGVPGTGTVSPAVMSALAGAMAGKLPNPTGNNPGVTCPGFLAG